VNGAWLIVRSLRFSPDRMEHWLNGLHRLGFETYYPMIRECRPVPRRRLSHAQRSSSAIIMRPAVVPFLPQLVFVRGRGCGTLVDYSESEYEYGKLVQVAFDLFRYSGVRGFVGENEPTPVSDAVIERMRSRERAGGGAIPGSTPVEYIFSKGDMVHVVNGAFSNQKGIVELPPDVPIERIDSFTRLRLTISGFKIIVAVSDVRKA
jgi:hypothetical protein